MITGCDYDMAKKKKKKTKSKSTLEIGIEVYALLLIFISILGLGKLGPVGKLITSFSLFLTGSAYMPFLVLLLILGIYAFLKKDWPDFFTTKMLGLYLFITGFLTFMHWDFIAENNGNASLIFRETLDCLVKGFNSLMNTGVVSDMVSVGGGIIGGVFALIFSKLFSILGMKIVTIILIIVGICMFTGFSISDFIRERITLAKEHKETKDPHNQESDEHHANNPLLTDKKVKISNGNEIEEEVEKPKIKSIDEFNEYYQTMMGTVMIPETCWPTVFKFDEPQNAVIRADSTDNMSSAGNAAAEIMNEGISTNSSKFKYKADDIMQQVRNMQKLSESTNTQLIWIASISLLVGGIGVMNIMLVSVTERTSEIGLKKAIGARKKVILYQFLTEAAMLTSIGGVIGVIVGIILSKVVSKISGVPTAISIPAIIGSVVFSMLIGVVFGLLPSVKAADLNPIDALRSE